MAAAAVISVASDSVESLLCSQGSISHKFRRCIRAQLSRTLLPTASVEDVDFAENVGGFHYFFAGKLSAS